jgi:hypothetical protein
MFAFANVLVYRWTQHVPQSRGVTTVTPHLLTTNTSVFVLPPGRERDEMGPKVNIVYLPVCPTNMKTEMLAISSISHPHLIQLRMNLLRFIHATVMYPRRFVNANVRICLIGHPDLLRS